MRFGYRRVVVGPIGDPIALVIDNWKFTVWRT